MWACPGGIPKGLRGMLWKKAVIQPAKSNCCCDGEELSAQDLLQKFSTSNGCLEKMTEAKHSQLVNQIVLDLERTCPRVFRRPDGVDGVLHVQETDGIRRSFRAELKPLFDLLHVVGHCTNFGYVGYHLGVEAATDSRL